MKFGFKGKAGNPGEWKKIDVKPDATKNGIVDMRVWQKDACEHLKDEKLMILNAPTGSGKSLLMCFISAFKLNKNKSLRCIISIPQTIIAKGFAGPHTLSTSDGEVNWCPQENLCVEKPDEGTVNRLITWLEGPHVVFNNKILICTHATLVAAYKKLKKTKRRDLLKNLLLWVDEAHHVQNASVEDQEDVVISNGIGEFIKYAVNNNISTGLVTATPFRGDRLSLLTDKMREKFRNFDLSFYEHLKTMNYLRSFSVDYVTCSPNWLESLPNILKDKRKDIIYIPHPISNHSTGDKYAEVEGIISAYQNIHGGKVVDTNNGLTLVNNFKVLDLVDEDRRSEKKDYINSIKNREDLDAIITLGMFKEGADWIWAERVIIIGTRESMTDNMQMIGRLFRDAPNKEQVEVIYLLPFSVDQKDEETFKNNLNNFLKAICASLILEEIMSPVSIKCPKDTSEKDTGEKLERVDYLGLAIPDCSLQQSLIEDVYELVSGIVCDNKDSIYEEFISSMPEILSEYGITDTPQQNIAQQIWVMINKPTLRMQGIDVDEIDFEIVKKCNPIDGLLKYTSGFCNVDTLEEFRKAVGLVNSADETKKILLQMAAEGEGRPSKTSKDEKIRKLGYALNRYTNKNRCYDAEFAKQIKELRPDWFINTASENKKILLDMAKTGEEKSNCRSSIWVAFFQYTNKKRGSYDPEFTKQIRELRPDWFKGRNFSKSNKDKLLYIANLSKPIPKELRKFLRIYTNKGKYNKCYDPEFDKKIRELRPDWFSDTVSENKKILLDIADKGGRKPPFSKGGLSRRLQDYTSTNNPLYDPEFTDKIKKVRPDWFPNKSKETKYLILKLAKDNSKKPKWNSPIGRKLISYINKSTGSYDKEFDKKIRELRPDWFVNTAEENKKKLLEIAKNGENKPEKNTKLYESYRSYVNINRCYDAEFTKQIKELRPDWFEKCK